MACGCSQFQPTHSRWWCLWKTVLKSKTLPGRERRGVKKCEKQPCGHLGERRRSGRRCYGCQSRESPAAGERTMVERVSSPWRIPRWSRWIYPEGRRSPQMTPCWTGEKEGMAERSCCRLTPSPVPCPPVPLGAGKELGVEERKRGGRRWCFVFVPCYPNLFQQAIN